MEVVYIIKIMVSALASNCSLVAVCLHVTTRGDNLFSDWYIPVPQTSKVLVR